MKKITLYLLFSLFSLLNCGGSSFNINIFLTTQGDPTLLSYYMEPSNSYSIWITYQSGYQYAADFNGRGKDSVSVPSDVQNEPVHIAIAVGNAAKEAIIQGETNGYIIVTDGQQIPIPLIRIK